jgi:sugar transferase (PEP-CTERM/EpsH1 system associated)
MATDPKPRLLYVAHRVPYPPDKGDRIRNYHLLRQLAERADVSLACLADEPVSAATLAELNRLCRDVAIVPVTKWGRRLRAGMSLLAGRSLSEGAFRSPELRARIADWHGARPFAAAVVSASSLAPYLRRDGLEAVPGFVDVVDCDGQKWDDFANAVTGPKRRLYRLEAKRVRALERDAASWAAACTLVSRAEADLFDRTCGPGSATVATNGVDLDYFRPTAAAESVACAFVGALDYLPNVDAAVWFANEIWPRVRAHHPAAEFRVIGRKPDPAVVRLGQMPGVVVVGPVPDVRPYVASAAVSVVPMRLSRGLQNKVLESLAMGRATVAAPPALAAIRAVPGRDLVKAESADEWVTAVCHLFDDPSERKRLGESGRRFVETNHEWATALAPLTELIDAATTPEPAEMATR